jgi:L-asparaginase / beta-aspartyl-peptidase
MLLKRWDRIGDSPIIGAGTYADNRSGAVSATGYGELFLRAVAAHDVCVRMRYLGESVSTATEAVLGEIARLGGDGGMVAIDPAGNIAMRFNSQGMYRGSIDIHGSVETHIW